MYEFIEKYFGLKNIEINLIKNCTIVDNSPSLKHILNNFPLFSQSSLHHHFRTVHTKNSIIIICSKAGFNVSEFNQFNYNNME